MAGSLRTFWLRQILAYAVFLASALLLAAILPDSWPQGVQAIFLVIPLGLSIWTLSLFRRRDRKREAALLP